MSHTTKKNHISFLPALAIFALACFIRYSRSYMSTYNTTLFALNYDYGFISRGLMGTLYNFLDGLLPWEMHNYIAVWNFNGLFTVVYFLMLFWFYKVCLDRCHPQDVRNMQHLIVFLSIFAFPMFMTSINFGRLDLYLFILMLLCVILILKEKYEWLIVLIGILCTCIHQGFVFTNANTILVLLLYKMLFTKETKNQRKYITIFVLFFLSISALFLYFEFFSHVNGELIVDEVKAAAKALSKSGKTYNPSIIMHEVLGQDVTEFEAEYHIDNMQDFPVFCVLFAPYIWYGFRFFIDLIRQKNASAKQRFVYLAFLLGGATMIPQFLLKVDYGRYMFNLIFYYVSLLIIALALQDAPISESLQDLKKRLTAKTPIPIIWFLYPFLLTPFKAVSISTQIHDFAEILFTELSFFLPMS